VYVLHTLFHILSSWKEGWEDQTSETSHLYFAILAAICNFHFPDDSCEL
jgi:hypothetical protein